MIDLLPQPVEPSEIVRVRYLQSVVEDFQARLGVDATLASRSCLDVDAPLDRKHELDIGFRASWDKFRARTFAARFGQRNSLLCGALGVPFEQTRKHLAAKAAASEQGAVFGDPEDA